MTDEDKQLINGREDRVKEAKREIIFGLATDSTNVTYKPTVLTLESIKYFLMLPLTKDLPFIHLTKIH